MLTELDAVYRAADLAFAGWSCPASTACCRFGVTGREPYVTSIELLAVRRAVAALGGARALRHLTAPPFDTAGLQSAPHPEVRSARAPARGALPMMAERPCPMLTRAGRCAIYAARPLGCRTFYCGDASPGATVRHRDVLALVRRVQEIAARHAPGGDLGRPLTRALPAA